MENKLKFSRSFVLALTLHVLLLSVFILSFDSDSPIMESRPAPEIIDATVIDETQVEAEAQRLKLEEENKRLQEQQRQQQLEAKRQQEEERLNQLKQQQLQEQQKAEALAKQHAEAAEAEQKRLAELKQQQEHLRNTLEFVASLVCL